MNNAFLWLGSSVSFLVHTFIMLSTFNVYRYTFGGLVKISDFSYDVIKADFA